MADDETMRLFVNFQQGSQVAAAEIFQKYIERLTSLARSRLSPKLRSRVDPDDVVQSVYRVFFDRAKDNEFHLERSGDLWRLLAAITIKKVHSKVEFHQAQKRAFEKDLAQSADPSSYGIPMEAVDREPTPDESVALDEELKYVFGQLEPSQREILEMRLQGLSIEEIAEAIQRSDRTVRRALEQVRKLLETRLGVE